MPSIVSPVLQRFETRVKAWIGRAAIRKSGAAPDGTVDLSALESSCNPAQQQSDRLGAFSFFAIEDRGRPQW